MNALIVIDVVNEFVNGKYGGEHAYDIIPSLNSTIVHFRENNEQVIFACDRHQDWHPEVQCLGEHSMSDLETSKIPEDVYFDDDDIVVPKMAYSAFYNTFLDSLLRSLNIDSLFLAGLTTETCVKHTAADAFYRGYDISIVKDAVSSPNRRYHELSIKYMSNFYNADLTSF